MVVVTEGRGLKGLLEIKGKILSYDSSILSYFQSHGQEMAQLSWSEGKITDLDFSLRGK